MKKSVELKQQLEALKNTIKNMMANGQTKEAHDKLAEVEELKNQIQVQEMLEKEEEKGFKGTPTKTVEDISETVVFNKMLLGKPLTAAEQEFMNQAGTPGQIETEDGRGGYLVPKEQQTQIKELKRGLKPLKDLCNVIPVTSLSGNMPLEVGSDDKLVQFDELTEINEGNLTFGNVSYAVKDYGDIIPISNSLLKDEKANLTDYIGRRFSRKAVRTENSKIIALLNTATEKNGTTFNAIKTALNKELDTAIATDAVIITNQSGFDWLDGLEDKNGRPLLQPVVTDPTKKAYSGHEIIVLSDTELAQADTKMRFFVGNMTEYIAFFDRQGVEMAVSEHAGFTKNATLMRVVERFDVQKVDAAAMVKVTITPAG